MNPIIFAKNTFEGYTQFLSELFNLRDPDFEAQLRRLIQYDLIHGSRLIRGPYLSLNRPFVEGKPLSELAREMTLHPSLSGIFDFDRLYRHQEETVRSVLSGHPTIVSTGTGSGKTEAFLIPIVHEAKTRPSARLQAILLYPMNALVNDQLLRLRKLLAGTGVSFARYTGDTPESSSTSLSRLKASRRFSDSELRDVSEGRLLPYEERASREEIRAEPPNILLTNYKQLEYLLIRNKDLSLLLNSDLRFVVLDEVHTYTGELGSEVACLLRRLRTLLPEDHKVTPIGTSATISSEERGGIEQVKRFASRLFAVPESTVNVIIESYEALPALPEGAAVPPPPVTPVDLLRQRLESAEDNELDFSRAIEDETKSLMNNPIFHALQRYFEKPALIAPFLKTMRGFPSRENRSEEDLLAEVYLYLLAGSSIAPNGQPLLRPKLHFFLKGIRDLAVQFTPFERKLILDETDGDLAYRIWPAFNCNFCGQHYYISDHNEVRLDSKGEADLWVPQGEEDSEEATGEPILFTDSNGQNPSPFEEALTVWLCPYCGTLHRSKADRCENPKCRQSGLIPVNRIDRKNDYRCLTCDRPLLKLGETDEMTGLRSLSSSQAVDLMVLSEHALNEAPEDRAKLLIFSDNRQEASFLSGFINERSKRFLYRKLLYETLPEGTARDWEEAAAKLTQTVIENRYPIEADASRLEPKTMLEKFRWFLIEEFASKIFFRNSLETLGLVRVEYRGLDREDTFWSDWEKRIDVPREKLLNAAGMILDLMRRNTGLKSNLLNLKDSNPLVFRNIIRKPKYFHPFVYSLRAPDRWLNRNGKSWLAKNGRSSFQSWLRKWFPEESIDDFLAGLWEHLISKNLLQPTENLRDSGFAVSEHQLLLVKTNDAKTPNETPVYQCSVCATRFNREIATADCPSWRCQGRLERTSVSYDDYAVKNYTVYLKKRPINASEHTGQVNSIQREQIEKDFKNPDSRLNCIVATPTLELGVDIGKLDMVTMANVPPTPANYDQRAGRAGRRQRIATVMVYCGKTAHDLYYYDNPPEMIRGEIQAPRFSLSNLPLIQKHLHSLWTTTLQQQLKESDQPLFDNYLPRHIGRYFAQIDWLGLTPEEEITKNEDYATSLRSLLEKYESALRVALNRFLNSFSLEDKRAFSGGIDSLMSFFIREMPKELNAILNHLRKRYLTMKRERIHLLTTDSYGTKIRLIGEVLKALKEESLATRAGDYYTLSVLSEYGFFPGYALQKGSMVMVNFEEDAIIEIDRPYALALREFAPVSRIYALGKRFTPSKYHMDTLSGFEGFVGQFLVGTETIEPVNKTGPRYEQPGDCVSESAHICDGNLKREGSIGDDENRRSIVSYDIRGLVQDYHLGGKTREFAGRAVTFCRKDRITLVNTGIKKRIAKSGYGFLVCNEDGTVFSETAAGQKEYQRHMDKLYHRKVPKDDVLKQKLLLHAHFVSDWLSFGPFETRNEAINWMEAFRLGMEFVLENGKESWDSFIMTKGVTYSPIFFETVPGGTGILELAFDAFEEIHQRAIKHLSGCDCASACYKCLKTYWNQAYHTVLNREAAIVCMQEVVGHRGGAVIEIPAKRALIEEPQCRETESPAEDAFEQILARYGLPQPIRQYVVKEPGVSTRVDFAYPQEKILIYIDGDAYHENRKALDKRQQILLEQSGYRVERIPAKELEDQIVIEDTIRKISTWLSNRSE